jgi:aminoglycoside 3-N-acetyltransferase I
MFEEVFEMKKFSMPTSEYLGELLGKENFHVFVALKEDSVIGGLTAYTLNQYYSQKPLAYIFDLAVASLWQRQGIGNALIMHTRSYFQQNGYSEVFVQADKIDDYAVDFYRKTKPTEEEDVLHFYYTLD